MGPIMVVRARSSVSVNGRESERTARRVPTTCSVAGRPPTDRVDRLRYRNRRLRRVRTPPQWCALPCRGPLTDASYLALRRSLVRTEGMGSPEHVRRSNVSGCAGRSTRAPGRGARRTPCPSDVSSVVVRCFGRNNLNTRSVNFEYRSSSSLSIGLPSTRRATWTRARPAGRPAPYPLYRETTASWPAPCDAGPGNVTQRPLSSLLVRVR